MMRFFERLKLVIGSYKWFRLCNYTRGRAWQDAWWQADLILRYTSNDEGDS